MRQPLFILFLQIRRAIDDDAARLFHDCEISLCRRQGFFQSLAVPFFDAHLGTADLFRRSRLFLSIFRQKVTDVDVFTIFDFDGYRHGPAVLEDDLVAAIVEDTDRVALRIGVAPFVFPIGLGIADGGQVGDRCFFGIGLALRVLALLGFSRLLLLGLGLLFLRLRIGRRCRRTSGSYQGEEQKDKGKITFHK